MSGLEPLAALGLACNILQLIEVGVNTVNLAKNVYQSSSPAVDQVLQDNAAVLKTISREAKAVPRPASPSKLDQQLITTADKCFAAARDLEEEVTFLLSNAKQNNLAATLKVVAKTTWRKRRLDRLKDSLENAEKLMTKTLLAQVWSRTGTAQLDLSKIKDDLRVFIQQYQSGTRDIKKLVSRESVLTREHISTSSKMTLEAINGVQKKITRLSVEANVQVDREQRERLLRSLKFPAFNERRNQVSEAHKNTFEWIFIGDDGPPQEDAEESDIEDSDWEDPDLEDIDLADPSEASWDLFSNWLSSTADIYWISGKPGSGKTTLVKYVLHHPKTMTYLNTWSPQALIISHYFWRPGNPMQQNIKGLLCSLLHQLLENSPAAAKYVLQDVQARSLGMKDTDSDWSVPELHSIFLQIISSYERPICIFIDGLDEVHPSEGSDELLDIVLQFPRCRDVKLCLSSRPEPILERRLSAYPHLRVQDLTRPDLDRYARDHVKLTGSTSDEALLDWHEGPRDPIKLLVDKAEGVFLWLILATKSINKGFTYRDTPGMIRQRIRALPGDLTRLYKDMWNRACEDSPEAYRQIAALYFRLILLGQDVSGALGGTAPSLIHLMLASTPLGDQLLEAIDNPADLLTEQTLLKACQEVDRGFKLYCFGLIESTKSVYESDRVVGWYGSLYNTLWSRYGRTRLQFIHRTAQDFLLDTVDGAEILHHDSTPEIPLFFAWARGQLAINQLFVGATFFLGNDARDYSDLFDQFPRGVTCSDDAARSRTIYYLEKLCNSGQLFSYWRNKIRFCGGLDFLKVAASVHDESILSRPRISALSKAMISEILLNLVSERSSGLTPAARKGFTDPLITILLSEGADPNWHGFTFYSEKYGTPFRSEECDPEGFSDVQTPFREYLNSMVLNSRQFEFSLGRLNWVVRNLHGFLSHSADLGDTFYHILHCMDFSDGIFRWRWEWNIPSALSNWERNFTGRPGIEPYDDFYLVLAFPTCTVVQALLEDCNTLNWDERHKRDSEYGEMMSLLERSREYLDKWSRWGDSRVIGRLIYKETEDPNQNPPAYDKVWQVPMEGNETRAVQELMEALEVCLLDSEIDSTSGNFVTQLVQQISWTTRANGARETYESLAQLGILGRTPDHEFHDLQDWVAKFQERLSIDGRSAGNTEASQHIESGSKS